MAPPCDTAKRGFPFAAVRDDDRDAMDRLPKRRMTANGRGVVAENGRPGVLIAGCRRKGSRIGRLERFLFDLGFTLVELLIAIAIIGSLAAIGVPAYNRYIQKARMTKCISEMQLLEKEILLFYLDNGTYPASLDDIGRGGMRDLWGNPYQYTNISLDLDNIEKNKGKGGGGVGKFRSYLSEKPINTDFDLYSMGPDGKSARPLTAKNSRDDIIRANNGGYYGVASDF